MHKFSFLILLITNSFLYSSQSQSNKIDESLWSGNTRDTLLCSAVRRNNRKEAQTLLRMGCDINEPNNFGHTPLMLAAAYNNIAMCKWLLNKKANINVYACDGTALSVAVRYNRHEAAMFLIERKADINQGNAFNYNTPLDRAATYGCELMMQLLLNHGVEVNSKLSDVEESPLAHAIYWGRCKHVLLLLQAGVNVLQIQQVFTKETYLHIAAARNRLDIIKLLLQYGADVLQVDGRNRKPIDVARNIQVKNLLNNPEQYLCLLSVAEHLAKKHFHFSAYFFVDAVSEWLGY